MQNDEESDEAIQCRHKFGHSRYLHSHRAGTASYDPAVKEAEDTLINGSHLSEAMKHEHRERQKIRKQLKIK